MFLIFTILAGCLSTSKRNTSSFPTTTATLPIVTTPSLSINGGFSTSTMPSSTNTALPLLPGISTLAQSDGFALLQEYLKNVPPCQLPCWGGITPGKSTLTDVQKQLTVFSGISNRTYFGPAGNSWIVGNLDVFYPLGNTVIEIWPGYIALSDGETVLGISIGTQSLPQNPEGLVYGDNDYNSLLSAYTLPQIFATYGMPTQTFVTAEIYVAEPTAPDYFKIHLMYQDQGIFITYTMPAEINEDSYKFCPSDSLIELDLIPQGNGDNYQEFFRQIGDDEWASFPSSPLNKSMEEALGMTTEEFYDLFSSSTTQCLESPISIWPEP